MKISTKGRYAIESVVDLAYNSKDNVESLKNISKRLNISKNYLEQIFISLKKNGIVKSVRGAQGGYQLAKDMDKLTAGDVIRAVEGNLSLVECVDNKKCPMSEDQYEDCITRIFWKKMTDEINSVVDDISIQSLVKIYEEYQSRIIEYYI